MFLTKDPICLFKGGSGIFFLDVSHIDVVFDVWTFINLHTVAGTARTFNVEGDLATRGLALHASSVFFEANYAL